MTVLSDNHMIDEDWDIPVLFFLRIDANAIFSYHRGELFFSSK